MSLIQIKSLTFSYPDSPEPVFSDFSLRLDTNWKLGVVGRNGRGKTTLFGLLCGKLQGRGEISADVPFVCFPCEIGDFSKPFYEIAEEVSPQAEFWQVRRETNLLGLDDELLFRPFGTLSGGERTKCLLAALFAGEGVPLLDEPTDHLDGAGREALAKYLSGKRGFFLISHDRAFLDGCCDHILALNRTGAELVRGNYSAWRAGRDGAESAERAEREKLERERARLRLSAARTADWAERAEAEKLGGGSVKEGGRYSVDRGYLGAKAAKLQKRAGVVRERREEAEARIREILRGFETEEEIRLAPEPFFRSELFSLRGIQLKAGDKLLLSDFDFSMRAGERVAVEGGNGRGKSTLFRLIAGEEVSFCGERNVSPRLKISYVPQMCEFHGTLAEFAAERGVDESKFKTFLYRFGFDARDFARDTSRMSQGQRKKAALCRSLCESANLYLWDEPLNYLDVVSREQLERAVIASGASILFVEHDAAFRRAVATRTVTLK